MREILFRAKRVKNNQWVEGSYHKHETRQVCPINDKLTLEEIEHLIIRDRFADWNMPKEIEATAVIPDTLGQYTGLTDKNGKRIFEGDIIKAKNPYTDEVYIGIVEWGNFYAFGVGFVILWDADTDNDISPSLFYWVNDVGVEVVGNCCDNPELIKGGENDG